jgi:hypothetical protein
MKKLFLITVGLTIIYIISAQSSHIYQVDKASILKNLYGNFNNNNATSFWIASDTGILNRFSIKEKLDTIYTSILKIDTIRVDKVDYLLVVTQAKPKEFDCHLCAPLLGIVLFIQDANSWGFYNQYFLSSIGSWGNATKPKLEYIGRDKFGISFKSGFTGQGYSSLAYIIFEIELRSFKRILIIDDYGADNLGNCDEQKGNCWSYNSVYSFIKTQKEYFDLIVKTKGTMCINAKIVSIDKSKVYHYLGKSYIEEN